MMVLFGHLAHETTDHRIAGMSGVYESIGLVWATGVDVFFIVSGFIMYYLTASNFGRPLYWREFLKRRIIRVVPLYWIFTVLMLVALWKVPGHIRHADAPLLRVIASFLFYPVVRADGQNQPILATGWTLEFEMFFYICFAACLVWRKKIGLGALILAFILFSLVGRFIPQYYSALRFWTSPIIMEFLLGILLAHLYLMKARVSHTVQFLCIASGFALLSVGSHLQFLDRWIWAGLPAFVLAFGLACGPEWNIGLLTLGGNASYSLYLSHPFTLNILTLLWLRLHLPPSTWAYILTGMVMCFVVSLGVYRFIEMPLLGLLRRKFEPTRAVLPA
jgi:peptidoglycan/LPS O-acetylase OafA/YrhL